MGTSRSAAVIVVAIVLGALPAGCSLVDGGGEDTGAAPDWAVAAVVVDGATHGVEDVVLALELGDEGYFNLSGTPSEHPDEDCVPGLGGGMNLYGDIPLVAGPEELVGQPLAVEFSGDGDDANFCFVGSNGLLGAETASLTINSVVDDRAEFTMSGSFQRYDEAGNAVPAQAEASGTARISSADE